MGDRKEMDVMFDTENSIILGDYLDLLLNRTMEQEEEYGERPKDGVYIRCSCDREIQNTITKLGLYEYILYADYNQKITKETADKPKKYRFTAAASGCRIIMERGKWMKDPAIL